MEAPQLDSRYACQASTPILRPCLFLPRRLNRAALLEEIAPGLTVEDVKRATEVALIVSPTLKIKENGASTSLQ